MKNTVLVTFLSIFLAFGAMAEKDKDNGLNGLTFDGPYDEAIVNGAIHLVALQCDQGGWIWSHGSCSPGDTPPYNIISPIVDGLMAAYEVIDLSVFMNAMVKAGDYNLESEYGAGNARLYSQTALNLWHLSTLTGDNVYTDWVKASFYEKLLTGTYGAAENLDTDAFIDNIRTSPSVSNLKAWEISSQVLAAERYCYQGIADKFEQGTLDALAALDNTDPAKGYDMIGLAGGVFALARVNRLSFPEILAPNHTSVNGETTLVGLADELVALQNSNGSFYWLSGDALGIAPTIDNQDTQTTAYAVLALIKAQERLPNSNYLAAIEMGKQWLLTMQEADGGFMSYPGDTAYNAEVEAEAIQALGAEGVYDRIFQGQMECYVN